MDAPRFNDSELPVQRMLGGMWTSIFAAAEAAVRVFANACVRIVYVRNVEVRLRRHGIG